MKKILIRILIAILVSLICACHAEIPESDCKLAFSIVGEQRGLADYSYESALEYQYQIQLVGIEASESEWVSFAYPGVQIFNLRKGKYELYVRAVKDKKIFSKGSKTITVKDNESNDFTVVLYPDQTEKGKGILTINESGQCNNLNVEITYDGPEYIVYKGTGNSSYSQELDKGFYVVSIVYKNNDTIVGGQTFTTYVEAYSVGTVKLVTGINKLVRNVEIDFINLSAPHVSGKVCTGYTLNGVRVTFPKTFDVTCDGIPTYSELGLEPEYADLDKPDQFMSKEHIEVWVEDLPVRGSFVGDNQLFYFYNDTPKTIVINGNPPNSSFSCLRDLETVVIRDASKVYAEAFFYDMKLKNIYLCSGITQCESDVFKGCNSITDFYLEASELDITFGSEINVNKYNFHYDCSF